MKLQQLYQSLEALEVFSRLEELEKRKPETKFFGGGGQGGGTWGSITGTLSNQTDLQTALDTLQSNIDAIDSSVTLQDAYDNSTTPVTLDLTTTGDLNVRSSAASSLFFIDESTGNVGIGTATPQALLNITGGSYAVNSDQDVLIGDDLQVGTTINRTKVVIGQFDENSELIMGQSSANNLVLNWQYNATAGSAYGSLNTYGYTNDLYLDGADLILQSRSAGNVGIGTTTPDGALDVAGGSTTRYAYLPVGTAAPGDATLDTDQMVAWVDESVGTEKLNFKVKLSSGTVMSASVNLT